MIRQGYRLVRTWVLGLSTWALLTLIEAADKRLSKE